MVDRRSNRPAPALCSGPAFRLLRAACGAPMAGQAATSTSRGRRTIGDGSDQDQGAGHDADDRAGGLGVPEGECAAEDGAGAQPGGDPGVRDLRQDQGTIHANSAAEPIRKVPAPRLRVVLARGRRPRHPSSRVGRTLDHCSAGDLRQDHHGPGDLREATHRGRTTDHGSRRHRRQRGPTRDTRPGQTRARIGHRQPPITGFSR